MRRQFGIINGVVVLLLLLLWSSETKKRLRIASEDGEGGVVVWSGSVVWYSVVW